MKVDDLRVIAPDKRKHGERLYDLIGKVFSELGYYRTRRMACTSYFNNSHYDWNASRIGLLGDEIVSHYGVWGYEMRIGTARVRAGGIGGVATHGDYRKKGLMDRTARASIQAMRELGYDMSILFGIRDFYEKFGYVRAWPETNFFAHTGELPKEKPAAPLRRFPVARLRSFADLYNRYYATYTGTAVRPTYLGAYPWSNSSHGYAWAGDDGRPAGYVLVGRRGHQLRVQEYCGDAEQALRALGRLARRWHCGDVYFETLPYTSDLAKRLRRGTCRVESHYHRSGSAMVRMVNLPQAMGKLTGELSRRLQASPLSAWHGGLLISDSWDQVMLSVRAGKIAIAPIGDTPHTIRGGDSVVQLLIGIDAPAEAMEASKMQLSGDAGKLGDVLFPAQYPQLSTPDHY